MPATVAAPELEPLQRLAPDAYGHLVDAVALAEQAVPPEVLEPIRLRLAAFFDGEAEAEPADTPLAQGLADLTDQFAFHVASVTDELRKPVEDGLSTEDLHEAMKVMYALDMSYRLRRMHQGLFTSAGDAPLAPLGPHTPSDGAAFDPALKEIWRIATRMADREVDDPETIEFLRLRCAHYHDCHT